MIFKCILLSSGFFFSLHICFTSTATAASYANTSTTVTINNTSTLFTTTNDATNVDASFFHNITHSIYLPITYNSTTMIFNVINHITITFSAFNMNYTTIPTTSHDIATTSNTTINTPCFFYCIH